MKLAVQTLGSLTHQNPEMNPGDKIPFTSIHRVPQRYALEAGDRWDGKLKSQVQWEPSATRGQHQHAAGTPLPPLREVNISFHQVPGMFWVRVMGGGVGKGKDTQASALMKFTFSCRRQTCSTLINKAVSSHNK